MKKALLFLAMTSALSACEDIPGAAYYQRGTPESLLSTTSERVSIDLTNNQNAQEQLVGWLNQSPPSRAEVHCVDGDLACAAAVRTLEDFNVPVDRFADGNVVHLMYESVAAKDCNNRYIDNPHNPYNLNHPTFGCTIATNIVQAVTDKKQLIRPELSDPADARRVYQVLRGAAQPNTFTAPNVTTNFKPMTGGTSGGSSGSR